nr:uncharacterized protein LOC107443221 isoform X1 [Parasteatoda tepidariorum]
MCNMSYSDRSELTRHSHVHTGVKPHSCSICNKSFSYRSDLTRHNRVHTGEKPYSCSICNKSFSQRGLLTRHNRVHTGEKPFFCSMCNMSFSDRSELTRHSHVHTGVKPHSCSICNKSFSYRSDLTRHNRVHTGEKPYSCSICNKSFSQRGQLTRHNRVHTGKCYCDQLLRMLSDNGTLKSEHLQFVINKYTREIDMQYLKNCNFCAIEERLEAVGSVITKFSMAGIKKFYNSDSFLRHLQNIQVLQLSETNCTNRSVEIIADNCSQLKSLDLSGCVKVTDAGLILLCGKSPPLECLNVEYTSVTYKSVALVLKNIPTLTKLSFDNVPRAIFEAIGWHDFSEVNDNQIFNLNNIVILNNPMRPENHLTAILKGCIKVCPFIKDLIVSELINEEQLDLCSQFENVVAVHLQCSTIVNPKLCINNFLQLRGDKLTSLLLTSFSVSIEMLANYCPNLEELTLQYPAFQQTTHRNIIFPHLKTFCLQHVVLELEENQLPSSCIISSSPNLRELHISFCVFSDEMQDVVLHCPKQLKILNFSNTVVSPQFIQDILEEHTDLSALVIGNSGISMADYDDIMDLVDERESKVQVVWADYSEAIRELFYDVTHNVHKRCILKL